MTEEKKTSIFGKIKRAILAENCCCCQTAAKSKDQCNEKCRYKKPE